MLTRLLTQTATAVFAFTGRMLIPPYAIAQAYATQGFLTQASEDTTPSTHIAGGFEKCSVVVCILQTKFYNMWLAGNS